MVDRTAGTLIVHSCPPHRVRAVCQILGEYDLNDDNAESSPTDQIVLGQSYSAGGIACGEAETIANALVGAAPEAIFTVWEDPAYEWLGELYRYAPEHGMFSASCDSEGNAVLQINVVLDLLAADEDTREIGLGLPWDRQIRALPRGGTAAAPPVSPEAGERPAGIPSPAPAAGDEQRETPSAPEPDRGQR